MRIRLLTRRDIPEVVKLFLLCNKNADKRLKWTREMAEKYILRSFRLNRDLCFAITENSKIIGVEICMTEPCFNKIIVSSQYVVVHPDYRKKGIATKLIRKLCNKASSKYKIEEIETSIYSLNNFPISWYESIGFKEKKHYTLVKGSIKEILKNT